jgi:hypothetical protein
MDMKRAEAAASALEKRALTVRVGKVGQAVVSVALDADVVEPYEITVARAKRAVQQLASQEPAVQSVRPAPGRSDPGALFWSWALPTNS